MSRPPPGPSSIVFQGAKMQTSVTGSAPSRTGVAIRTILLAAGAAWLASAPAQAAPSTIQVVYSFGGAGDGEYPSEALIEHNGVFYGTTFNGGAGSSGPGTGGCGTVFGLTPPPSVKTFTHSLQSINGCGPKSLAVGADGNLYGANENFGMENLAVSTHGSVFRITTGGTLTRLHLF